MDRRHWCLAAAGLLAEVIATRISAIENYVHAQVAIQVRRLEQRLVDATSTEAFYADPVRRYMLPVFSDRRTDWPSHPLASRDSLHEAEMWAVEGLTHRYPTKVLAELLPTCPQYCGSC